MRITAVCFTIMSLGLIAGAAQTAPGAKEGVAVIHPASGSTLKGIVRFAEEGSMVKMVADLEGLAPNSQHGFHVHEFGDCSAADASSAGSHYDPIQTKLHGKPGDKGVHAGDMGNIAADAGGKAHYELTLHGISIAGPQSPILGRAVIVHAKPDDFGQPVGNAGGRIGCGVIGIAKR
jgi:Cu-Zn family superoxide dismutase